MRAEIFLNRSVEQNAAAYYERAKKARQKLAGVGKTVAEAERKLSALLREKERALNEIEHTEAARAAARPKEWYEKFHWFHSSEGFLCIGGRDATSNEIVVKKHAEAPDLVFHADIPGSPFFAVKNGKDAGSATKQEAAQATAAYSKAWKLGVTTIDVFSVKPEQVSKKTKAGEYLGKGAFMVYGEKEYFHPILEVAIGVTAEGRMVGGPVGAVKAQAEKRVLLVPGQRKGSDVAKKVAKLLGAGSVDEAMAFVPSGGCEVRGR